MKIFFSLVTLGVLAFIIHKLGAKKIVNKIEDTLHIKHTDGGTETKADNTALVTDTKTLADLEASNKDLLDRIKKLQDANKWNVKDDKGFYYSVDSKGEIFSGDNSSDEYNVMVKQLADYNAKKDELTKKIAAETPDANKQSLELPLAVKAIIESIKSKFSHKQGLDDDDENEDTENNNNSNTDNYNNEKYSDGGNYGGGGGSAMPYTPSFPPLTPAQVAVISPAVVTPVSTITQPIVAAPFVPPHFHFNPKGLVFNNPLHVVNNTGAIARTGFRRR